MDLGLCKHEADQIGGVSVRVQLEAEAVKLSPWKLVRKLESVLLLGQVLKSS